MILDRHIYKSGFEKYSGLIIQRLMLLAMFSLATSPSYAQEPQPEKLAQLRVLANPADTEISVNGETKGTTPLTMTLKSGQYLIQADKMGYKSIRQTINLAPEQRKTCDLRLHPVNGLVLIHSNPTGAEITIDGASRGTTPLFLSDLPLGRYRAKFSKRGFLPKEVEINIDSRSPKKVDISLTSDSAQLTIDSVPQGAGITLNGITRGNTPCTVDRIPSGVAKLEMALDGYEIYNDTVNLAAGESENITAKLKAIPSNLKIITIPAEARIYVNNQFRGTSPVDITNIALGTYKVRAEMATYDTMLRNVTVGRAQNLVKEFRLQSNAGTLKITTEPAGVSILLSGKSVGVTETKTNSTDRISEILSIYPISSGNHEITLTKVGYFSQKSDITIIRDQAITKHFKLKRRFIPNYEIKTASEVYRGVLIEVDAHQNVKLEIHPGILKTIPRDEILFYRPLREDQLKKDL